MPLAIMPKSYKVGIVKRNSTSSTHRRKKSFILAIPWFLMQSAKINILEKQFRNAKDAGTSHIILQ